jgi:glycosyltransferase involved in cell wall biosynthesis
LYKNEKNYNGGEYMKILYVLDIYPILSESFIRDEIEEMRERGHEIIIGTFKNGDNTLKLPDSLSDYNNFNELKFSKKEAVKILIKNINRLRFSFKQKNIPLKEILFHSAKISNFVKKHKIEHIHAHFGLNAAAFAIQAGNLSNTPVSFTVHGFDVNKANLDMSAKLQFANKVFSVSEILKMRIIKRNNIKKIYQNKIEVIPFGVKVKNKATKKIRNDRYLFVGRFNKVKGIEHILNIWKENKSLNWIDLIGFGEENEERNIIERIKENNLKINLLGKRNSKEIYEAMSEYKAIILPFQINKITGEQDTGAIVAKEAMLNEIPVITTDLIPHIVDNKTGLIAKSGDAKTLFQEIKRLDSLSKEEIKRITDKAYLTILEKYSIDKQIKDFESCITNLNQRGKT